MLSKKTLRHVLSLLLVLTMLGSLMVPAVSANNGTTVSETSVSTPTEPIRGVNPGIVIDSDATGGYEGDYVVIYNPATSSSTSYSTGTMTGLIQTTVNTNTNASVQRSADQESKPYKIDVDPLMAEAAKTARIEEPVATRASYSVGSTKTFSIYSTYSPTGSGSVQFKCLYVGSHCYIWTPTSSSNNTYPLDTIDSSFAKLAADEFDSKFDLMQSSFGNHTNGSSGDGKLHILYYNINDGWQPGQGYIAGFFYQVDISNNGLPILNIDTYPGVYYKNSSGTEYKRMDDTYNTMVHEYQHLINYSNTSGMSTWLNECFSAAAEEICYPGSSLVGRIQSWENYYYSDNNDWLNPPSEFQYQSSYNLHNGYSLYAWNNNLDDILALYSQVSFFAQYLYTRFGNTIYKQISNKFSSSEVTAITNATGVSCADLARDFRIAVTANAAQDQYNGIYGFKVQNGYDPSKYHDVQSPYDLLAPVIFTGSSCSIKGGGAITVKPVNGVYNPPSGANSNLKYYGIKLASAYTVTAVSNNTNYGTVSVNGTTITATPKSGYYVSDAQVTSGTATVSINGNIITVNPSSNCTVKVIFAAKPQYTVTYKANGSTTGTATAYVNDVITLPTTATSVNGYTFAGWTAAQVAETTTKPSYFAPGASYTVTANATLYALYTRSEGGTGASYFELLSSAPSDWSGNYVITYGTSSSSMYLMKGVTPSSNGAQIESSSNASSYANSGASLSNNQLSNVSNSYIFTFAPSGSYYTVKNVSTGTYLGLASNSYLGAYTTYTANYCDWTPGTGSNASSMKSAYSGSYPYLGWSTNSSYFWSSSSVNTSVRLWKEANGSTVYYTTSPTAVTHTHTAGSAVQENYVAPTCTVAGSYDEVVYCTTCGEELSRTAKTVAALGHNAGTPVQENYVAATATTDGGYDTVTYCTRCNAELSRVHTTLPATGPSVYYTVSFSVPSGVTAPSSQTVGSGSSVTLPTAGAPSGYSFVGWVTGTVNNSTTRPTVLTGSYTPTANITLYALYSYSEGSGGAVTFDLVTSAPSNWSGNYVITYGTASSSMYLMKGVSVSSNGTQIESSSNAVSYANSGASLSNNQLSNVANDYIFTLAPSGSYYTLKSVSTGTYVGLASNSYLGGYNTYTSSYCDWTPGVGSNASSLKCAYSGSYPYMGFSTSSKYFWTNSSVNTSVRLWKQGQGGGTTYYTTEIGSTTPDPEPTYYTVSFSVPSGVTKPSNQTVEVGGTITLPTAGAPSGYTFLGWVTSTVSNATTQPTTYTGTVTVNGNVTLYALYSYTSSSGGTTTGYQLMTSAPSSWAGSYMITYGTSTSSLYVLKGLSGNTKYESASAGGAVLYSNAGMTYSDGVMTGVTNAYVWNVAADSSYYKIQNASTGTYLGSYNSYLYSRSSYSSSYCRWTLSMDSSGNVTAKNTASSSYPYLSFSSSNYFLVNRTAPTGLYFWQQTTTGGSSVTYYTTG